MSESNDPFGTGSSSPGADWYPDPSGNGGQRYWDGNAWTDHVRAPAAQPWQQQPAINQYASPKSPILAIVLSVLWLGAGHFYAGRSDTLPIVFAVLNGFLWVITLMCLIGVIAWIPLVIFAAIDARKAAIDFNNRHGLATPT
jgi:TM2 domain-containing membrane protein YozV